MKFFIALSVIFLMFSEAKAAIVKEITAGTCPAKINKVLLSENFITPSELYSDWGVDDLKRRKLIAVTQGLQDVMSARRKTVEAVLVLDLKISLSDLASNLKNPPYEISILDKDTHLYGLQVLRIRGLNKNILSFLSNPSAQRQVIWAGLKLSNGIENYLGIYFESSEANEYSDGYTPPSQRGNGSDIGSGQDNLGPRKWMGGDSFRKSVVNSF